MTKASAPVYLSIGEVAAQSGVRTSALRYYESIGLLPTPKRVNGRRCYEESILQWLALLQLAQRAGFTMNEIHELFHGFREETPPAERWQTMAHKKLAEIEQMMARAQQMKQILEMGLRCGCLQWEDCVLVMGTACQQNTKDRTNDRTNDPLAQS